MKIQIITNKHSGKGLTLDGEFLKSILEEVGHQVHIADFFQPNTGGKADLNIFCEVVIPEFFSYAPRQWWIPNIEFAHDDYLRHLNIFQKILCKTMDAYNVLSKISDTAIYTGFIARDRYRPDVPKERKFLHIFGNSIVRSTHTVIDTWRCYDMDYPLTIVGDAFDDLLLPHDVRHHRRLEEADLTWVMNVHQFIICTSQYEGFGHSLNEARSTGATIITVDAPPMNEFPYSVKIPPVNTWKRCLASMAVVNTDGILDGVRRALELSEEDLLGNLIGSRIEFLKRNEDFKRRLLDLCTDLNH